MFWPKRFKIALVLTFLIYSLNNNKINDAALMESFDLSTILLLSLSCIALGLAIIALMASRTLNQKFQKSLEIINSLHKHVQQKDEQLMQLDERLSGSELNKRADGQRVTHLEAQLLSEISRLEHLIEDAQQQDPTTKRYQKANELLLNGASIEEVMDSCEIPRAEVDILLGLLRRN